MNSPKRLPNRQQVENQFDRAASSYDRVAGLQRRMGETLLERLRALNIKPESPIIDLGCGTGELLRQLHDDGFSKLTGLDLSSQMIAIAKKKSSAANFVRADIESIPCRDASFDVVVSNAAVQWCDPDLAATEIHRVVKPGGRLLLNSFIAGTLGQWHQAFEANGFESRVHLLADSERVTSAFADAGFELIEVQQFRETSTFDSIKSMFASIKQLGATNAMESRSRPMSRREYESLKQHFQVQLDAGKPLGLDFLWVQIEAKSPTAPRQNSDAKQR
ncbi:methyltransferase domain-containing protein [Mariniblastus fucicola]|uniref:Malonyl-[acyl-carrier protein] O-methyltransferase n=1 Tax=Mariniblastus fucicola TaxID=980251 RepID=A0A5B9PHK0_9BACT|nr:methyltransferase domain-containing protein [Mariniblastus fucicola]QEG25089.1 Malonyl-[acyl-carrier protein] O-methyltransferase [Mariniblastus fucicola]